MSKLPKDFAGYDSYWDVTPVQVCPLCGAVESARRNFSSVQSWYGRVRVRVQPVFTSNYCRKCSGRMMQKCPISSCGSVIRDGTSKACWRCGRLYPWAKNLASEEWRHHAEILGFAGGEQRKKIWLYVGDITGIRVDAIVSPNDFYGRMRGEVANRILEAAGDIVGSRVGEKREPGAAWDTEAGNLTKRSGVKRVIHIAVMDVDGTCDPDVISRAIVQSLRKADASKVTDIAFPAIGTGSGGLTIAESAKNMIGAIYEHLNSSDTIVRDVICVVIDESKASQFRRAVQEDGFEPVKRRRIREIVVSWAARTFLSSPERLRINSH